MLALRCTCSRSDQIRQPTHVDEHEIRIAFKTVLPMHSSPPRQIKVCPYAGHSRTRGDSFWRAVRGLFERAIAFTGKVLSTTLLTDLTVVPQESPIFSTLANHIAAADFAIELKDLAEAEVTDLSTLSQLLPGLSKCLDALQGHFTASRNGIKSLDTNVGRTKGHAMERLWNVLTAGDGLLQPDAREARDGLVDAMQSRAPMRNRSGQSPDVSIGIYDGLIVCH